ncbi:hypothetical protein QVN76_07375 [Yersinia rochesterensis]|uniref:hypothetical protein n=1 Tax=Yersinia rochesterensis TaxID=1604335 RepID=UPI0025AB3764|nr:hypothetical protein [Yersinia rochesterensis]MDN0106712.1 hypothetical protein [Yersinia rochesterensis]
MNNEEIMEARQNVRLNKFIYKHSVKADFYETVQRCIKHGKFKTKGDVCLRSCVGRKEKIINSKSLRIECISDFITVRLK